MVDVKPFNAIVYNQEKVDIKDVIAPPYDVISDDYKEELYKRSEYNIAKLILPEGSVNLDDENNRYKNAKNTFLEWLDKKILIKYKNPVILYLIQKYKTSNGKEIIRKGFIARCKIEDFSAKKIFPHEYTMGAPKQDRLKLTSECKANFSQVFFVYSDKQKCIENLINYSKDPIIDVIDDLGVQNTVYLIDDEQTLNKITNTMQDKTLLIADGHHRYETAMNYRNLHPENEDAKYVMSYFTNMEDDLLIFPTHRIITKRIEPYDLLQKIKKYFDIEEFNFDGTNKNEVKQRFLNEIEVKNAQIISMGLYMKNVNKFYVLSLRENVDRILDEYSVPEVLRKLDLIVLHKVLISKEFGYSEEEQMSQDGILYIKQEQEAFDMIDRGIAEASFIMGYPKIKDIEEISSNGERMPQKSTYFYPKLLSGISINQIG